MGGPTGEAMTQRVVLLLGVIMAITVIDGAWLSRLGSIASPDLLIVVVALCGLRYGVEAGALLGGAAGYIEDLVTGAPLGLHMLLFVVLGAASGAARPIVDVHQRLVPLAAAVVSTVAVTVLTAALARALHLGIVDWATVGADAALTAGLNALLAGPVAALLWWIDHVTRRRYAGRTIGHRVLR
jgi:rod shape-determining protein MreD